ncbi:hypothetical protein Q8A73_008282 [Channa argus]|nr:hypothetical protein Q8A73_008282 [Channa argus]
MSLCVSAPLSPSLRSPDAHTHSPALCDDNLSGDSSGRSTGNCLGFGAAVLSGWECCFYSIIHNTKFASSKFAMMELVTERSTVRILLSATIFPAPESLLQLFPLCKKHPGKQPCIGWVPLDSAVRENETWTGSLSSAGSSGN